MADLRYHLRLALASCLFAALPLHAQTVVDPANLTGEHVAPQALADTLPINHGVPALQQLLVKLGTRASMMLIVAHPDDEDGGFLTYESRGQGARAAMLTLNRGEGGQNLMSADFDDALGLIRTQELLAAGRYMGVDQFFGTEIDFGFSKTKEESFAQWTHDRVLYDAVRAVRLYRPLVIASVFRGSVTDGHGQHQVSGEIAQEVFNAAADPKIFPEIGLPAWAPMKVYARTPFARIDAQGMYDSATGKYSPVLFHNYVTGTDTTKTPTATVIIHEGDPSTLLGMNGDTYVQFARKGLSLQKSQIGGGGRGGGPGGGAADVGYTLMGSRVSGQKATEEGVFDGVDTSIAGIATLAPAAPSTLRPKLESIAKSIAEAQRLFDAAKPEAVVPPLRQALRDVDALIAATERSNFDPKQRFDVLHELRVKRVQLNNAMLLALGVSAHAVEEQVAPLTPGSQASMRITVELPKSEGGVKKSGVQLQTPMGLLDPTGTPAPNEATFSFSLPQDIPLTQPYFSKSKPEQSFYDISNPALRNAPETPAPFVGVVRLSSDGVPLELRTVVASASAASPEQAAAVVPRLSVAISPAVHIVSTATATRAPLDFSVSVRTNVAGIDPHIELAMPKTWKITTPPGQFTLAKVNDSHEVQVSVLPTGFDTGRTKKDSTLVSAFALDIKHGDKVGANLGYRAVGYKGLTTTNLYKLADLRVIGVDVTTAPNLKVAYLPGTGDSDPEFLPNIGVTPQVITLSDLTVEKLMGFDAVVLGVRAYSAHAELAGAGSKPLIDYAKRGGVVIVQYNNGRYGADEAPFPITTALSSGDHAHDVVDESQPVKLLEPEAALLTWPNRITEADFNNWVEERGHGFAGTWSKEYTALLETHDAEQDLQKGGLLVAPVGKGAYIYCGLALYRQLLQGVPGAYRLFANLLSYGKNPRR